MPSLSVSRESPESNLTLFCGVGVATGDAPSRLRVDESFGNHSRQVWSLIQFCSVSFLQLCIRVKSEFVLPTHNQGLHKLFLTVLQTFVCLAQYRSWRYPCISEVPQAIHKARFGVFEGLCVNSKSPSRVMAERQGSCLQERKITMFSTFIGCLH